MVTALNRESFLERLEKVKKGKIDMVIMFFSNDACALCEELWPVLDRTIQLFQKQDTSKKDKCMFGSVNMEYNELNYLETFGSLPVFYPVIRYFHSKT
jgi:hypothetical protein